jgi:hypothetical protein
MNAHAPPKEKRAPAKSALRNLRLIGAYHVAAFHAKLFEGPFWFLEQMRSQLAEPHENQGQR